MQLPASVQGRERIRVFVGLPLPAPESAELERWLDGLDVGEARRVRTADLHLTLAFLGQRPVAELERIVAVIDELRGLPRPLFSVERYRERKSVAMLSLGDEGGRGAALAEHAQRRLEEEGVYRREQRPWLPHVTVLRFQRPPRLRPELPPLERIAPSEAAAFLSVLRSSGAQYEVIHRITLGPS